MPVPSQPLGANNPIKKQFLNLLSSIGKGALHSLYPNDFEYYACSLELVDSSGRTIDFFTFPVMPSQINQSEGKILSIRKTAGGITTLNTTTFEPIDINLSGNFGRRLRILIGGQIEDIAGVSFSTTDGKYTRESIKAGAGRIKKSNFNARIKTGFGCMKILQAIYRKANAVDDRGNPFRLIFYNPALGENFLVKPMNLKLTQDKQENMIWNYNLQMKAIANIDGITNGSDERSISKTLQAALLGQAANQVASSIKKTVLNGITP